MTSTSARDGADEADETAAAGGAAAGGAAAAEGLPVSYEAARDELTTVVERLEAGGLTLDESLALWERGQALAAACERFLAGAHRRVQEALAESDGNGDPAAAVVRGGGSPDDA